MSLSLSVLKAAIRRILPGTIRPYRILAGRLRGARIVTSWRDYPAGVMGRTERHLLDWFQREVHAGETWLDIGAHYGYTAIALARSVGRDGRVFAFEPVVATAGCVARTRMLNGLSQLTVVPLGLGTPENLMSMRLPLERGMADLTKSDDVGRAEECLQIARLDWLWPRLNGGRDRIDGIKIDVQGMEIDVLRGMVDLLRRHRPKLVIEFHAGVNRSTLLELISGAGYPTSAHAIEPQGNTRHDELRDDRSYAFRADGGNFPAIE